jgi:uncharacterized protein with von Willebrand factor type A (vWA) domain
MSGSRWKEARAALRLIAPHAVKCDEDGVTLYFFGSGLPTKRENVKSAHDVESAFDSLSPGGGTDLTTALRVAFDEHFNNPAHIPSTLLVITGTPHHFHLPPCIIQ